MNKVKTITTKTTIIDQMNKVFVNCFDFRFVFKNLGKIRSKTAIKKKAGTICSNPIF